MPSLQSLVGAFTILCLALSACASRAEADIYRWVSPEGILSFGQSPPRADARALTRLDDTVEGSPTATEDAGRPEGVAATGAPLTAAAPVPVADNLQETVLEEEPLPVFTLSAVELPRLYLSEADFQELSEMGESPLGTEATSVVLSAVSLNEVSLAGTDLAAVRLPGASLTGAYLSEADLELISLPRAV